MDTAAMLTGLGDAFADGMIVAAGVAPLALLYSLAWSIINRGKGQVK